MDTADRLAFARGLGAVGEAFNEPVSELRAEAYFDALCDLAITDVLTALRAVVRDGRFFPKPVEVRERVTGSVEDRAELAWVDLLEQVRAVGSYGRPEFEDEDTDDLIRTLFGGFRRLCETLPAGGPELLGIAKQFKATYAAQARRDLANGITVQRLLRADPSVLPAGDDGRDRLHHAVSDLAASKVMR